MPGVLLSDEEWESYFHEIFDVQKKYGFVVEGEREIELEKFREEYRKKKIEGIQ
jgi:hypothetical protein